MTEFAAAQNTHVASERDSDPARWSGACARGAHATGHTAPKDGKVQIDPSLSLSLSLPLPLPLPLPPSPSPSPLSLQRSCTSSHTLETRINAMRYTVSDIASRRGRPLSSAIGWSWSSRRAGGRASRHTAPGARAIGLPMSNMHMQLAASAAFILSAAPRRRPAAVSSGS